MRRVGLQGHFTNQQVRSCTITAALVSGMDDNAIQAITGHRSAAGLNEYRAPSLVWKKKSRARMFSSITGDNQTCSNKRIKMEKVKNFAEFPTD